VKQQDFFFLDTRAFLPEQLLYIYVGIARAYKSDTLYSGYGVS